MTAIDFYWLGGWAGIGGAFLGLNILFWGAALAVGLLEWLRGRS
ncbi:MAG TPA: hypothetical protein VMW08_11900 [Acidimicrobiales bacterium]|nr:hypothetical protein [Acidimicrobiales bacterium]